MISWSYIKCTNVNSMGCYSVTLTYHKLCQQNVYRHVTLSAMCSYKANQIRTYQGAFSFVQFASVKPATENSWSLGGSEQFHEWLL